MTNQLDRLRNQAAELFGQSVAPNQYSRRSAMGKAIAQQDQRTELQARHDYNQAKLIAHRDTLETFIEKQRANQRAELSQQAMMNARALNDVASHLSNGNVALDMILGEIQAAHNTGEVMRIIKRGAGE